jgi:voltage-gated potassium channel
MASCCITGAFLFVYPGNSAEEDDVNEKETERIGSFQIFLVGLSIYVLIAIFIESVVPLSESSRLILLHVDNIICFVFLYDFFYRFARADNKWHFLRWGWIDLVSSIPSLIFFRVGRAIRIVRVLRLVRGFRSVETIAKVLFANRAKGTLATAGLISTLLVVFSSIAILSVETDASSNIRGPEDALWWSIVTITTVGYGDRYPVTTEGRLIGTVLMLSGVGLFAVLSAAFAAWFIESPQGESNPTVTSGEQLAALVEEIRKLRAELHQATATDATLPASRQHINS